MQKAKHVRSFTPGAWSRTNSPRTPRSSTNLSVIEQQTYLAQAQTTEVMTKAAWLKAAAQLDRALGQTMEKSGIWLKAAQGDVSSAQH
jgi:hypothetical protein